MDLKYLYCKDHKTLYSRINSRSLVIIHLYPHTYIIILLMNQYIIFFMINIVLFWLQYSACSCEKICRQILKKLCPTQWGVLFKGKVEGWTGGGMVEVAGINQRGKNPLPGSRTSAIPDKSKRIFSRTTHHCGEYIYLFN